MIKSSQAIEMVNYGQTRGIPVKELGIDGRVAGGL